MKRTLIVDRREFTRETLLVALSGVVITVSGCGGGDGGSPTSPSPTGGAGVGTVGANHGHSAVISDAQITAGNTVQLDIQGAADHPHAVTLTADAVQAIRAGRPVGAISTSNTSPTSPSHSHTVTFNGDAGDPTYY
jgi:hypothetical protein